MNVSIRRDNDDANINAEVNEIDENNNNMVVSIE